MSSLITKQFENYDIRFIPTDAGSFYVVGIDLARAWGYADATHLTRLLDEDEVILHKVEDGLKPQVVITESGFYNACFKSQHESAKRVRKWVTTEVLPSIRKTGSYALPTPTSQIDDKIKVISYASSVVIDPKINANQYLAANILRLLEIETGVRVQLLTSALPATTEPQFKESAMDMAVKYLGANPGNSRAGGTINDALIDLGFLAADRSGPTEEGTPHCQTRPGPPLHGGNGRTVETRFWSPYVSAKVKEFLQ